MFMLGGKPAKWVTLPPDDELPNCTPTGIKFACYAMEATTEKLYRLMKRMCLDSEVEKYSDEQGFALHSWEDDRRLPGGMSCKQMELLNEFWSEHKPINDPLSRDQVFHTYVINTKLFLQTKLYYETISFNCLSQSMGKVFPKVREKLIEKDQKEPQLKFDMVAALSPIRLLEMVFFVEKGRTIESYLDNPLTQLGLVEYPWYFKVKYTMSMMHSNPAPGPEPAYQINSNREKFEQGRLEANERKKQKSKDRKALMKEKPELFKTKNE